MNAELRTRLLALLADAPTPSPPGRIGRWLTDRFNEYGPRARGRRHSRPSWHGRLIPRRPRATEPVSSLWHTRPTTEEQEAAWQRRGCRPTETSTGPA